MNSRDDIYDRITNHTVVETTAIPPLAMFSYVCYNSTVSKYGLNLEVCDLRVYILLAAVTLQIVISVGKENVCERRLEEVLGE